MSPGRKITLQRISFIAALSVLVTLLPFVGCASQVPTALQATGTAQDPGALSGEPSLASKLLPHPAFAYAKGAAGEVTIADVAERAAPSVVNVSSSKRVAVARGPLFDSPAFRHFFGPGRGPGAGRAPEEREQKGLGSGVIVSADGLVLTNNHVVEDASEIKVMTSDEREFDAEVVGTDDKSDLAVLRLKGKIEGLQPIAFGDSSRLRLGDLVLAIGNPFGLGQTITMGIVSAKGRANMGIVDYEDFIQTDAAINPGNSGGALVDMEGRLVGINTAILSRSGGYQGIGFAIPSNMARPIMKSLVDDGKVVRGWLGVGIQDLDPALAKALGVATTKGVLVSDVMKAGPAAAAGMQRGDVIVRVAGQPMDSTGRLRNAIAAAGANQKVEVVLLREGKERRLSVTLGQLADGAAEPAAQAGSGGTRGATPDGLTVAPLDDAARKHFGIPDDVDRGVVVRGVAPGSPAAKAGLRPGDVIAELDRKPVSSVNEFKQLHAKTGKTALLLVRRGAHTLYVALER